MCISNNAYERERVSFDDTILYAAVVRNPANGQVEHVLGYYNKVSAQAAAAAANRSDFGWDYQGEQGNDFGWELKPAPQKVGNAMLFAVPAKPGTLTAESLIPVSDFPRFMEDYKEAVAPKAKSMSRGAVSFGTLGGDSDAFVVKGFDNGTYDVVVAPGGASQIAQVIAQVDEDKRPQLNEKLYAELGVLYPNFTFVLFCFAEKDAEQAGCALIRYTPQFEHLLYMPGLDGHNGFVERGKVALKHTLVLGHYQMKQGVGEYVDFSDDELADKVDAYSNDTGDMRRIAPRPKRPYYIVSRVIGRVLPEGAEVPQGDFLASVDEVRAGIFRVRRQVPMGWKDLSDKAPDPAGGKKFYITDNEIGAGTSAPATLGVLGVQRRG